MEIETLLHQASKKRDAAKWRADTVFEIEVKKIQSICTHKNKSGKSTLYKCRHGYNDYTYICSKCQKEVKEISVKELWR